MMIDLKFNLKIFDKTKIGNRDSGWFGKGFYFTLSKGEAEYYGKNILPVYLSIKNPFDFSKYYKNIKHIDKHRMLPK